MAPFPRLGLNYRLSDIQAAVGVGQMGRIEELISARRVCADYYREILTDLDELGLPGDADGHSYQSFVTLVDPGIERSASLRNSVMAALSDAGIGTRPGTHAPARLECYGGSGEGTPNACLAEDLSIALPLYAGLSESEMDRVAETLQSAFRV